MKDKKGYSLIEIAIGIAIIIIFIVGTSSLINASYDRYRLILQRNEAMEFAVREMENVLQSGEINIFDYGHNENNMQSRVKIEKVKKDNIVYSDKVFLVTVDVDYSRALNDEKKYNIQLKSLKVVE